jgi:hypothetical protein
MSNMKEYLLDQDLPLFRVTDPDTSRQGAQAVKPRQGSQAMKLLEMYEYADLTDEQAGVLSGLASDARCGFWKRCSDLRRLGFIQDSGDRRMTLSGTPAMVCFITDVGREALR